MTKTRQIHLLYFNGCPNVEAARRNLREALIRAGRPPAWEETDVRSGDAPPAWKGFPSPTVLVGGRDVASGKELAAGGGACRYGGAPSVEAIVKALAGAKSGGWLASLSAVPAGLMGVAPGLFCPACYPALVGLLSSVGLGTLATDAVLAPLTAAFLVIALAGLGFQARRSGSYRPLVPGILGAACLYAGLFLAPSKTLRLAGVALLIGASAWNVISQFRKRKMEKTCPSCG